MLQVKLFISVSISFCFIKPYIFALPKLHPSESNNRFRNNFNRNGARPPSGRGDEDCTTDFLLIPGGKGNLTRFGNYEFVFESQLEPAKVITFDGAIRSAIVCI